MDLTELAEVFQKVLVLQKKELPKALSMSLFYPFCEY